MHCTFSGLSILATILPIVCVSPVYFIELGDPTYTTVARLTATILLIVLNVGFFFHPWKIVYKDQMLFVKTIAKTFKIKLRWCRYDDYEPGRLQDCKRIAGIHGSWGYYGIYDDFLLGKIRVCATNTDNLVIIQREGELPLVINDFSPLFNY